MFYYILEIKGFFKGKCVSFNIVVFINSFLNFSEDVKFGNVFVWFFWLCFLEVWDKIKFYLIDILKVLKLWRKKV